MDSVEAEGSTIDGAIAAALAALATTRDRVEIEILSNAARGLFGIGGRKARIRATLRKPIDADSIAALPAAAAPPAGGSVEHARQVLQDIVRRIGVAAEVAVTNVDGQTVLQLNGDTSGVLIGRRGQMLDALEYLLNRIVTRDGGGVTRFVVDSENYRQRRRQSLEELAQRMAEQAKRRGRPVTLNPMSPRDRRIIHLLLENAPGLTTKSAGKGFYRRLIIIPAGGGKSARSRAEDEPLE
jgi:spoIIIJ-associated protein